MTGKPFKTEINLSIAQVVDALGEIQARFIEEQLPSRSTPYILCGDLQSRYSLRKVNFFARNEDGTDQGNLAAFFPEPLPPTRFEFFANDAGIYRLAWIVQLTDKAHSTVIHVALPDNPTDIMQTNYDVFVHFLEELAAEIDVMKQVGEVLEGKQESKARQATGLPRENQQIMTTAAHYGVIHKRKKQAVAAGLMGTTDKTYRTYRNNGWFLTDNDFKAMTGKTPAQYWTERTED